MNANPLITSAVEGLYGSTQLHEGKLLHSAANYCSFGQNVQAMLRH